MDFQHCFTVFSFYPKSSETFNLNKWQFFYLILKKIFNAKVITMEMRLYFPKSKFLDFSKN